MTLRPRLRTGVTKPVDLRKHGGSSHDQKSHGNWARGLKVFPFQDPDTGEFHQVATRRSKPNRNLDRTLCGKSCKDMVRSAPFPPGDPRGLVHFDRGCPTCRTVLSELDNFERHRDQYRTNKIRRPDLLNLPDTGEIEVTFLGRKVGSLQYRLNRPKDYEILSESYLPEHEEWGRRVAREKLEDPIAKHPGPDGSPTHGTGTDQSIHAGGAGVSLARINSLKDELEAATPSRATEIRRWALDHIRRLNEDRHQSLEGSTVQRLTNLYYTADNVVEVRKHPGPDGSELHGTGSDQTVHGGHRTVFHGTRWMKGEEILENGWNPELEGRGLGGVWGKGAYFAPGYEAAESWAGRTGNAVVLQAEIPDDVKILQVQSAGLSPAAISGAYIPTEEGRLELFRASNSQEVVDIFEEVGRLYDEEDVFPTEAVERVVTDAGYQALEVLPGTEEARVEGMEFFATGGHQLVIYDEAVTTKLKFRVAAPFITGSPESSYEWTEPTLAPKWVRELEAASSVSKRQRTWFTVVRRNHLPKDVLAETIVKHAGPGPHPGTGTPQQAHAGIGGMQVVDEGTVREVDERDSAMEITERYVSPIEHSHPVGPMPPSLEATLVKGRPVTERFKETMATKGDLMDEIQNELDVVLTKKRIPENELWAVERKMNATVGHIAMYEASRYPGMDRTDQVKAWLLDPANGNTYSERIDSFRSMMREGTAQKLEIELTKAQYFEVSEWEGRGEIAYWSEIDDPGIEIEELRTRNGRIKGGTLRIKDEDSLEALKKRAQWVFEDARMGFGPGGGTPGRIRSMEILNEKLSTAVAPVADPVEPTDTFWAVTLQEGSGGLWEDGIEYYHAPGQGPELPMRETIFFAGEHRRNKFVGPIDRVGDQWEIPEGAVRTGGTWQWDPEDTGVSTTYRSRLVSSENLVDRLLADANYLQPIQHELSVEVGQLKSAANKLRTKRRNLHQDMVAGFLKSEGIRTGTEINVAAKRGSAKKLANDSRQLPAVWVEKYNEMTENRPLTVHKKRGGGTYFSRNFQKNKGGPHINTDGSVSTNLHEIGHGFEDLGGMKPRVQQFFNYRTNNGQIQSRVVSNGRLYSDSFTDSYSGKKYDWGDHEILSNGIGNLYGGHRGLPDDEHLDFLFGLMMETAVDE